VVEAVVIVLEQDRHAVQRTVADAAVALIEGIERARLGQRGGVEREHPAYRPAAAGLRRIIKGVDARLVETQQPLAAQLAAVGEARAAGQRGVHGGEIGLDQFEHRTGFALGPRGQGAATATGGEQGECRQQQRQGERVTAHGKSRRQARSGTQSRCQLQVSAGEIPPS
jgi:hypothetical protein